MARLGRRGLVTALVLGGIWTAAACGGSSGSPVAAVDSGTDAKTTVPDSGSTLTPDSGDETPDTGTGDDDSSTPDATPPPDACAPNQACALPDGTNGVTDALCNCNTCDANGATATASDSACQSAYAGTLCISSNCVPGDCRSTDGTTAPGCSGGQICGITTANACGACTSAADCTTAYGAGYLCSVSGKCVAATCATSADCNAGMTAGEVCVDNQCGQCTNDSECAGDEYYAGKGLTICDSTNHVCSSPKSCTSGNACDGNHLCCSTTCLPGTSYVATGNDRSCCATSDCVLAGMPTATCVNNQCTTTCSAVTDGGYYVDPVNGSDDAASGSNSDGCRFKTLAHALSVIASVSGNKSVYLINDDDPTANTSESFPLSIPASTSVIGVDTPGFPKKARTILVPAGANGFVVDKANVSLQYLTIDGVNGAAADATKRYGTAITIASANGGSLTGVKLDHVTVTHSLYDGIVIGGLVNGVSLGGNVAFGPGMNVNGAGFLAGTLANGNMGAMPANGVVVAGNANLTLTDGKADNSNVTPDQSSYSNNSQHGVAVLNRASLTVSGHPVAGNGSYLTSSILASGNNIANLLIAQTPDGASTADAAWTSMSANTITGFVSTNAANGNGIRIQGGSKVTMRKSISLGNAGAGIRIETGGTAATLAADANYIAAIDLGSAGAAGQNVLQVPTTSTAVTANKGVGICLAIAANATGGPTLAAEGNTFADSTDKSVDCSAVAGTLVHATTDCRPVAGKSTALGVAPSANNTNAIDVTMCE